MKHTAIYFLSDPETGEIRYVGKTIQKPECRFRKHLFNAKNGERGARAEWIRSLAQRGLLPLFAVIDWCDADEWETCEMGWIARMRLLGCELFNLAEGGRGSTGHKMPREAVEKFASKLRGRPKSPEHRHKLSLSHLGMKASIETKRKMSIAHTGRKMPAEAIAKTAAAHRGMKRSKETREKLRMWWAARLRTRSLNQALPLI